MTIELKYGLQRTSSTGKVRSGQYLIPYSRYIYFYGKSSWLPVELAKTFPTNNLTHVTTYGAEFPFQLQKIFLDIIHSPIKTHPWKMLLSICRFPFKFQHWVSFMLTLRATMRSTFTFTPFTFTLSNEPNLTPSQFHPHNIHHRVLLCGIEGGKGKLKINQSQWQSSIPITFTYIS